MSQNNSLTWFITGCSSGFGRELTKVVLARGYQPAHDRPAVNDWPTPTQGR